jgi:hypothetical protein
MARRLLRKLTTALTPAGQPTVHFHRGPSGAAAPCYDTGCPRPRLSRADAEPA